MLRLAHRILSQALPWKMRCDGGEWTDHTKTEYEGSRIALASAEIVIADNVADYDASIRRDMFRLSDFPGFAPPWEKFFIEWKVPSSLVDFDESGKSVPINTFGISHLGVLFRAIEFSHWIDMCARHPVREEVKHENNNQSQSMWVLKCSGPFSSVNGLASSDGSAVIIWVDRNGIILSVLPIPGFLFNKAQFSDGQWMRVFTTAFLTLSFINCKNVVKRDATDTEGPNAKWLRRQKQPAIRYHILDINPMKETLRTEGGVERNGLKKALHICRGHFATYTPDHPLFGHFVGTVWKPSHVRGNLDQGAVVKDYSVQPKREASATQ